MTFEKKSASTAEPSFYSSPGLPPSRNALVSLGLVDVVHQVRGGPRAASGGGGRRWLEGCIPVCLSTDRLPLTVRAAHPVDSGFFQDHVTPIPHLITPQWFEETDRALILQKNNVSFILSASKLAET